MATNGAEPAGPGLRERKRARTKAALQRHALSLFAEHGYAETSVEQIAAAAEVSPSTFFRYFATKGDVVLADFMDERVFEAMVAAPPELDPLAALRHGVDAAFRGLDQHDLELEMLRNELLRDVPELRRGLLAELTRPVRRLAEATAIRLGRDADEPEIRMFAGAVIGAMALDPAEKPLIEDPPRPGRRMTVPALLDRMTATAEVLPRLINVPARGHRSSR